MGLGVGHAGPPVNAEYFADVGGAEDFLVDEVDEVRAAVQARADALARHDGSALRESPRRLRVDVAPGRHLRSRALRRRQERNGLSVAGADTGRRPGDRRRIDRGPRLRRDRRDPDAERLRALPHAHDADLGCVRGSSGSASQVTPHPACDLSGSSEPRRRKAAKGLDWNGLAGQLWQQSSVLDTRRPNHAMCSGW